MSTVTPYSFPRKRRSRRVGWIWLVLLGFILLSAGSAFGQNRDDVRAQLERTDQLLENAQDLISEAGSVPGKTILEQAARKQQNAWDSFDRGHFGLALTITNRARDDIYRALGNIRQTENNDSEVERQLERTDIVIGEARDRLGMTPALNARRVLEMAIGAQQRAWDLFRERKLRPALRLTLEARDMIVRLAGEVHDRRGGGLLDDATFQARFDQLTQVLERVNERAEGTNDAGVNNHLERARQLMDNARKAFDDGDAGRADQALDSARRELERAMRLVVADVRAEDVAILITTAEERLDLLRSLVTESAGNDVHTWLEQAAASLTEAREALTEGRTQRALFQTRRAVDLLNRVADEVQQ